MSWNFLRRVVQLLAGIFLYGFAIAMMIRAGLGVSPWDVLSQGTSLQSGLPFGLVTNLIGLGVLLGLVLQMEYIGFWLGDALAGFTPFWIGLVFYLTGQWKKGRMVPEKETDDE